MTFPLPERGIDRYESWVWTVDDDGAGWEPHSSSSNLKLVRRDLYNLTLMGSPAYIFARKRGKIIETNEDALREAECEEDNE